MQNPTPRVFLYLFLSFLVAAFHFLSHFLTFAYFNRRPTSSCYILIAFMCDRWFKQKDILCPWLPIEDARE